jgi:hypothetical protein
MPHAVWYWNSPASHNTAAGLRQQISDVKIPKVVEQMEPQPLQETPT